MLKKTLFFLGWMCCFFSCSHQVSNKKWWENNSKPKILTTLAMIQNLVEEIGGDDVDVITLIQGELDPHSYELVKGDDEKFERADLIFYNGLGLEHTLSLRQKLIAHPHAIAVADVILEQAPQLILYQDSQIDPHVWMDVTLWMRTIDPIVKGLSELDPIHTKEFKERAERLRSRFEATDRLVYQTMQKIPPDRRYLITSHDAFHYFVRRYLAVPGEKEWRARCAAPEGLAPDSSLSLTDIYNILALVEKYHVPVLFPESNLSRDSLRKIMRVSRERGCEVMLADQPLYGDSMGEASSYLEMISHNVDVISHELMRTE